MWDLGDKFQSEYFGFPQSLSFHQCSVWIYYIYIYIYRVSQEEGTKLREGVPYLMFVVYVKLYRKTPKHLYPKLNGLGDNGN
jgi:hypothetical protein